MSSLLRTEKQQNLVLMAIKPVITDVCLSVCICGVSAERLFDCLWSLNGSQERRRSGRIWTNRHQLFLHASLGSHLKIFNWLMACSQIIRQAEEVFDVLEF